MSEQSSTPNEKDAPKIGAEVGEREATLERLKNLAAVLKEASLPNAIIQKTGVLSSGGAEQNDGVVTYLDDDEKLLARVEGFSGRNSDLLVSVGFPAAAELGYPMPSGIDTEGLFVEHVIEARGGAIKVVTQMKPVTEPAGPYRYVTHAGSATNQQQPGETASCSIYDTFDLTGPAPTINRSQQVARVNEELHLDYERSKGELPIETVPDHALEFIADALEATVQAMDDPNRWEKIRPRPVS